MKKKSSESSEISFDDFSDLEHLIASTKLTAGPNDEMEMGRFAKWFGSSGVDDTRTNKQTTGRSKFMSLIDTSEDASNTQEEHKRKDERYDGISQQTHHHQQQSDNTSKNKESSNALKALFTSVGPQLNQHQHQERHPTFSAAQFTDVGSLEEQILQSYGGAADSSANKVETQKSSPGFNVSAFFDTQFPDHHHQQHQQHQWQHQQDMHMIPRHHQHHQYSAPQGFTPYGEHFIHPYQHQQHQSDRIGKPDGVSSAPPRSSSGKSNPSASNVPTPRQHRSSKSSSGISLFPTQMLLREGRMIRKSSMSEKKDSPKVDKGTMNPTPNMPYGAPYHPPEMMHPQLPNNIHYQMNQSAQQWAPKSMQPQQQMMMAPMNPNQTMYMQQQQPYPQQQQQQQHHYPQHFHTHSSSNGLKHHTYK